MNQSERDSRDNLFRAIFLEYQDTAAAQLISARKVNVPISRAGWAKLRRGTLVPVYSCYQRCYTLLRTLIWL